MFLLLRPAGASRGRPRRHAIAALGQAASLALVALPIARPAQAPRRLSKRPVLDGAELAALPSAAGWLQTCRRIAGPPPVGAPSGARRWRSGLGHNPRAGAQGAQRLAHERDREGKVNAACKAGAGPVGGNASAGYHNPSGYGLSEPTTVNQGK